MPAKNVTNRDLVKNAKSKAEHLIYQQLGPSNCMEFELGFEVVTSHALPEREKEAMAAHKTSYEREERARQALPLEHHSEYRRFRVPRRFFFSLWSRGV